MYPRADPLGSPPLVLETERGRDVDQPVAAATLAAALLRGELENGVAAFPPAAEDAEQPGVAFAAADVDAFGRWGTPVTVRSFGESA
jgi:hypothetical protein